MRGHPKLIRLEDAGGNLKSPFWYVQWSEGRRSRRCSTGCLVGAQDHEATQFLAAFILERNKPRTRQPDELLIATALDDYYEEHGRHTASVVNCESAMKAIKAYFGAATVASLTRATVRAYVEDRRRGKVKDGTIRRDLALLRSALNHEVKEGRLTIVPAFDLPPAGVPRERWLTREEAHRLESACVSPHILTFIKIALATAQRASAIEQLIWSQVDFAAGVIHFNPPGRRQNSKKRSSVPMTMHLQEHLEQLHQIRQTDHVLEFRKYRTTIHAGSVKKAFERTVKRAGLQDITRHTLRHTAATWMAREGVPLWEISGVLGHSDISTTTKNYLKYSPDTLRKAVSVLEPCAQIVRKSQTRKSEKKRETA